MTELEIAEGLIAGSSEAFEKFVELYRTKVFQYSYSLCGHREDAEEVAQDTLLSVFQHLAQIREPEHLKAWVFRIARNACLMKRRRGVFEPAVKEPLDEMDPLDSAPLPERVVMAEEQKHLLCGAIVQLPEIYRAVVMLRDVEELSTAETAEILAVSEDVVKTRLKRARRALRDELKRATAGEWHLEDPAPLDATCKRRLIDAYHAALSTS
jgi:RNA polymerase sigma-70 factor (ECF subfamily)